MRLLRLTAFCASTFVLSGGSDGAQAQPNPPLAIEGVTVDTMAADGAILTDCTVLIRDGRIVSIESAVTAKLPAGVRRVSGAGRWLMPTLTDAHVHIENDRLLRLYLHNPYLPNGSVRPDELFLPYVANGVLEVFDLSAMPETVGQRDEIERGDVLGPHIALAQMIDGNPPIWPIGMTRVAATPEGGRQIVRDAHADGFDIIKVYSNLDLLAFTAIVDEAHQLHMPVVGHIPQREKGITEKFFQPGYGMVAHAEEFAQQTHMPSETDIPRYVAMAKANGTWLTATLTLDERILQETENPATLKSRPELQFVTPVLYPVVTAHNPYVAKASAEQIGYMRAVVAFNAKLVRAFNAAGIPILAGTDTPVPGLVAGFALHDELEALARAGLSTQQVLEAATRLPAKWLGIVKDRGTVAAGKRADLLLLDGDPMANVANTRRIAAVIDGGRYLPRAELDRRMRELAATYTRERAALSQH